MMFKILLSFGQIVGSFLFTFELEWPAQLEKFFGSLSVLQFDVVALPSAGCTLGKISFFMRLMAQTLGPLVVLVLLAVPSIVVGVVGAAKHGGIRNHPRRQPVVSRFYQSVMILVFILYPAVSTAVLKSYTCIDYGADGRWLRADHRVDCDSAEYEKIWWFSLPFLLLYPIGIPLFVLGTMIRLGVWKLARKKEETARFTEMLNLRHRQLSTVFTHHPKMQLLPFPHCSYPLIALTRSDRTYPLLRAAVAEHSGERAWFYR